MHQNSGDIHHIVPKDYLQKNGFPDRGDYNQVANFALTETSINISISNKPPDVYMAEVAAQITTGALTLGEITDAADLAKNLQENAIPAASKRSLQANTRTSSTNGRKLMATVIHTYHQGL